MNRQRKPSDDGTEDAQEHDQIRAVYEEYTLRDAQVAMISDPENEYAWIQSSVTVDLEAHA